MSDAFDAIAARRRIAARVLLTIAIGLLLQGPAGATRPDWSRLDAPNLVVIDPLLATAGQPGIAALTQLRAVGVQAVVYLAPRAGPDWVPEEAALLRAQGIEQIHVPFPADGPSAAQFDAVSSALTRLRGQRVLVHCQVNWQASTFVFLHRAIVRREDPAAAYEAVAKVWSPAPAWKSFVSALLGKHGIAFEPY